MICDNKSICIHLEKIYSYDVIAKKKRKKQENFYRKKRSK